MRVRYFARPTILTFGRGCSVIRARGVLESSASRLLYYMDFRWATKKPFSELSPRRNAEIEWPNVQAERRIGLQYMDSRFYQYYCSIVISNYNELWAWQLEETHTQCPYFLQSRQLNVQVQTTIPLMTVWWLCLLPGDGTIFNLVYLNWWHFRASSRLFQSAHNMQGWWSSKVSNHVVASQR